MKPLAGHKVVAAGAMAGRPLARFLASLGADLVRGGPDELEGASFLIDDAGAEGFAEAGWPRARIEQLHPALVHVSVTPFGSGGPRGAWQSGELVASAMGGTLRLTGQPDRRPVKEAPT